MSKLTPLGPTKDEADALGREFYELLRRWRHLDKGGGLLDLMELQRDAEVFGKRLDLATRRAIAAEAGEDGYLSEDLEEKTPGRPTCTCGACVLLDAGANVVPETHDDSCPVYLERDDG